MKTNNTYSPSRRSWIKLWTFEFLEGSVRWELTPAERSVFIDFLAWAGKSRYPGVICAKKQEDSSYFGYPLDYIASILVCDPELIKSAIQKCKENNKIRVTITNFNGIDYYTIEIVNWKVYQSEYLRKRPYKKTKDDSKSDTSTDKESDTLEGEGD